MSKKRLLLALLLAAAVFPAAAQQAAPDKFLKEVVDSALCPDGLGLYRTDKNKIYLSFPEKYLGRRILVGGAVSSVSDPGAVSIGQRNGQPLCLKVEVDGQYVVLSEPVPVGASPDADLSLAVERNFTPSVIRRVPLQSLQGKGSVAFEITPLITKVAPRGTDFKLASEDNTSWFGTMKAFGDNATLRLHQNISGNGLGGKATVSMVSTVSVLVLPEDTMRPRIQDARIGVFSTGSPGGGSRYELSTGRDGMFPYRFANRWRIEPVDMDAWRSGRSVAVRKPIVWYIDDSFPELWKQPIREGILAWNAAFEAFGLEDVLQVRDFPEAGEDPGFDPENLKYNCVRYVPNSTANAMGPSWADPLTGEILNASVLVFNDVARLLNNWRFVQTAQVDERVRCKKLPDEVLQEALVYVVSHEIGHTLGLLHNMAGSAAVPVDSLRSASFMNERGLTSSIMDYARFNYVAQPGDKGVKLIPPSLGIYDRYAIEWLYKPVDAEDMWEESRIAGALIDSHAGDPWYRFGAQQSASALVQYDPTARTQDLGDDPIRAGNYAVSNLKYILPNIKDWIEDDPDFSHRSQLYTQLCSQYGRYLNNVLALIGGVVLTKVKDGTPGSPCVPVPAARQREALRWVLDEVRSSGWLDEPDLTSHFGLHSPESNKIASTVGLSLASAAPLAVSTAVANGSAYSLEEYFDDLFSMLFHSGRLTSQEKTLQRSIVSGMSRAAAPQPAKPASLDDGEFCFGEAISPTQSPVDVSAVNETAGYRLQFLRKVAKMAGKRRSSARPGERAHYEYLYETARKALL